MLPLLGKRRSQIHTKSIKFHFGCKTSVVNETLDIQSQASHGNFVVSGCFRLVGKIHRLYWPFLSLIASLYRRPFQPSGRSSGPRLAKKLTVMEKTKMEAQTSNSPLGPLGPRIGFHCRSQVLLQLETLCPRR